MVFSALFASILLASGIAAQKLSYPPSQWKIGDQFQAQVYRYFKAGDLRRVGCLNVHGQRGFSQLLYSNSAFECKIFEFTDISGGSPDSKTVSFKQISTGRVINRNGHFIYASDPKEAKQTGFAINRATATDLPGEKREVLTIRPSAVSKELRAQYDSGDLVTKFSGFTVYMTLERVLKNCGICPTQIERRFHTGQTWNLSGSSVAVDARCTAGSSALCQYDGITAETKGQQVYCLLGCTGYVTSGPHIDACKPVKVPENNCQDPFIYATENQVTYRLPKQVTTPSPSQFPAGTAPCQSCPVTFLTPFLYTLGIANHNANQTLTCSYEGETTYDHARCEYNPDGTLVLSSSQVCPKTAPLSVSACQSPGLPADSGNVTIIPRKKQ